MEYYKYYRKYDFGYDLILVPKDGTGKIVTFSHSIPWDSQSRDQDAVEMTDQMMLLLLVEEQTINTSWYRYVKKGNILSVVSKRDEYEETANELLNLMDNCQMAWGFLAMSEEQRHRAKEYVLSCLCLVDMKEKNFRFPVFASYNFLHSNNYENVPVFLEISASQVADLMNLM